MKLIQKRLVSFAATALLSIACTLSGRAEVQPIWITDTARGYVFISYQAPGTDYVAFSISCNTSNGSGILRPGGNAIDVAPGETITVTISGPGGRYSVKGTAVAHPMDGSIDVEITVRSALGAAIPLSRPGTLTIQYPANRYTIPLGDNSAEALRLFQKQCPPIGYGN